MRKWLGPTGQLAQSIPGFTHREEQLAVACAVGTSLREGRPCLAEAGTGVGKTLAYLVPLLRWCEATGKRAAVSTHTLALQQQLVERDIPAVSDALQTNVEVAVLKGRRNYLCLHEFEASQREPWTRADLAFLQVETWVRQTRTGDFAELPLSAPFLADLSATQDTCKGRECRFADRCFHLKARRQADDAQLLVVNHALFLTDIEWRRRHPGAPSLLPDVDAVVFDEAHHVEDTALRTFGTEWSSGSIPRLLARCRRFPDLDPTRLTALETAHLHFLQGFLPAGDMDCLLEEWLSSTEARSMAAVLRDNVTAALERVAADAERVAQQTTDTIAKDQCAGLSRIAARLAGNLAESLPDNTDPEHFHWMATRTSKTGTRTIALRRTPYTVSDLLGDHLHARIPRSIFVSATLGSLGSFHNARQQLGLDTTPCLRSPVEIQQGSPFDYGRQCLLYIPKPTHPGETTPPTVANTLAEIRSLLEIGQGRAFVLFTSHRMLEIARGEFEGCLPWPVLCQGSMPHRRLVEQFIRDSPSVLLGTGSFWEGVDVPGPALSLVILDKLPFAVPDAPTEKARARQWKAAGRDPFREMALPQASLRLKQGFGRLLRTGNDRGVVAILDPRLRTKEYGATLLADLPPCPQTDSLADVERFFQVPPNDWGSSIPS